MKSSNFQIIMMVVFIAAAVLGLLVFSGKIKLGGDDNTAGSLGTVTIWGTVKQANINEALQDFNTANPTFTVKYVQKFPDTFDRDLIEAFASGTGPDMFFLPDNLAYRYKNKITPIPYTSYPVTSFKTNFVGAGEIFLTSKGILAFPVSVDPMVMYYNRNMLDTDNVIYPPVYWDEFASLTKVLTKVNESKRIIQSTVAFGQFTNVTNAKNLLVTLFMQAGNPIILEKENYYISVLKDLKVKPTLDSIIKFYIDFTDPEQDVYSWNRSLPNSQNFFASDNLAFYFGYARELQTLISKNPNLNFQVAPMPQIRGNNFKLTSAQVTGIAISASSKKFDTAFIAASLLATSDFASRYATASGTVPARRDLLSKASPTDQYSPTFYSSALYAKSWLDPLPGGSDNLFRGMIDGILSNNLTPKDAVDDLESKFNLLLR